MSVELLKPNFYKMNKIRVAIQKSGRLSEKSLDLFKSCGIQISNGNRKLKTEAKNFPMEILFLRDDDIPQYVEQGIADIGILGENEVWEKNKKVDSILPLGFGSCRLSLAIPKDIKYPGLSFFEGKKVATSYPGILSRYFQENKVQVEIEEIGGSVEIAPGIGLADGIFDIVSTGSTLFTNGLKEVEIVAKSEAVIIANQNIKPETKILLESLLFRVQSVLQAKENKYILLNAPDDQLESISNVLPGMRSPTVVPLQREGWSSLQSVVKEDQFWEVIDQLKAMGAEGILVVPIEKMIL
ncbi:MAG: ATP phosphoribosyltransferase [Lentimonas sp.]